MGADVLRDPFKAIIMDAARDERQYTQWTPHG